jgi:hypothetical protein
MPCTRPARRVLPLLRQQRLLAHHRNNFERALKFGRDEQPQSKLDKLEALVVNDHGRPLGDMRFIASMLSVPCEERATGRWP